MSVKTEVKMLVEMSSVYSVQEGTYQPEKSESGAAGQCTKDRRESRCRQWSCPRNRDGRRGDQAVLVDYKIIRVMKPGLKAWPKGGWPKTPLSNVSDESVAIASGEAVRLEVVNQPQNKRCDWSENTASVTGTLYIASTTHL